MSGKPLIYLASPIKHTDLKVVADRHALMVYAQHALAKAGFHVYCSAVHWYFAAYCMPDGLPKDWDTFWGPVSLHFLSKCDELYVVMLEGFDTSNGVAKEVVYARDHKIPTSFVPFPVKVLPDGSVDLRLLNKMEPDTGG